MQGRSTENTSSQLCPSMPKFSLSGWLLSCFPNLWRCIAIATLVPLYKRRVSALASSRVFFRLDTQYQLLVCFITPSWCSPASQICRLGFDIHPRIFSAITIANISFILFSFFCLYYSHHTCIIFLHIPQHIKQKISTVVMLISNNTDCNLKILARDKKKYYIMMKGSICQADTAVTKICTKQQNLQVCGTSADRIKREKKATCNNSRANYDSTLHNGENTQTWHQ